MKIGVFDSGLGGLLITKAFVTSLSQYDYAYLGDTKRVPYGNRSHDTIYEFLKEGVQFLFENDCKLIIVACNTASAQALRRIQQEYLPIHYPDRRVLGVIIPTCESALEDDSVKAVGILATSATVASQAYVHELHKINPHILVFQQAAPLLVPFVENDSIHLAGPALMEYLVPFAGKIDALLLGCTHYPILRHEIEEIVGPNVKIVSQDEIIPKKLANYLTRHPEIERDLSKGGTCHLFVTDLTHSMKNSVSKWFGDIVGLEVVEL